MDSLAGHVEGIGRGTDEFGRDVPRLPQKSDLYVAIKQRNRAAQKERQKLKKQEAKGDEDDLDEDVKPRKEDERRTPSPSRAPAAAETDTPQDRPSLLPADRPSRYPDAPMSYASRFRPITRAPEAGPSRSFTRQI